MIQINDYDLPITAAEKLIKGTREANEEETNVAVEVREKLCELFGTNPAPDMFTVEELEEIAAYLMVYVEKHKNGD